MRTLIGLTVLAAAVSPAIADNAKDRAKAKALYESGLAHYNVAEYPEAIKDWKESYSLSKAPLLLFNIGQAYRLSGDCKLANIFYGNYQREEPNPKNPEELEQAIALCAQGATKPVDTKPVDTRPVDTRPVDTKPVDTKPVDTKPLDTRPGDTQPVETRTVDTHVDSGPQTTGGGMRKIGIGVGAAGAVLTGIGIYFAIDSGSKADEVDGHTGEWTQKEQDIQDAGKRSAKLAWITGGVGAAALIAGGVMFVIGGPEHAETSQVSIAPTRGGAAFGYSFRF
jgi:hypothetical protein